MAATLQQVQELHMTEGSGGVWQGGQGLNPTTAGRSVEPARACGKPLMECEDKRFDSIRKLFKVFSYLSFLGVGGMNTCF